VNESESDTTEQNAPITGVVARILNSRELVINRGTDHGVDVGMYFEVLAPEGEDIKDPETGQSLGSIERPKVAVRIIEAQPLLSVARTYRSRQRNVGGMGVSGRAFSRLFEPPKYVTQYDTLKTTEQTWENLSEDESYVRSGDPVRQMIEKPE
jgi:hypothetical protein